MSAAASQKPRLIGRHGVAVLGAGPHDEHADDRGEDPDGRDDQREQHRRGRVACGWSVKAEYPRISDDDDGDLVGLEEVGRHAGAVADVVADVVGDGGRVAGVVLGDARLDLAHQVGPDVGRLGEDAAADPHEQGEQRGAEGEADQHGGGRVLEDQDDARWRRAARGRRRACR